MSRFLIQLNSYIETKRLHATLNFLLLLYRTCMTAGGRRIFRPRADKKNADSSIAYLSLPEVNLPLDLEIEHTL